MRISTLLVFVAVSVIVFQAYDTIKYGAENERSIIAHLLLRMPSPTPLLVEIVADAPFGAFLWEEVPLVLGEYISPRSSGSSLVAYYPQPAHIDAWAKLGVFGLLLILCMVALFLHWIGHLLIEMSRDSKVERSYLALASVSSAPLMYYVFQVSLPDSLISSYSIAYWCVPGIVIVTLLKVVKKRR